MWVSVYELNGVVGSERWQLDTAMKVSHWHTAERHRNSSWYRATVYYEPRSTCADDIIIPTVDAVM